MADRPTGRNLGMREGLRRLPSMGHTLGRGRFAAMERLLSSGSAMEPSAEEASYEKGTAQSIQKEMNEADEANLLEEEDMHVFDRKPLMDPLHLVSCNTCKKPIKASQYAAHAERCRLLNASDDTGLELDGGTGHKKPPRKARKKVQMSHDNQGLTAGDQEISESLDGDDNAASESANVDDSQTGIASSIGREVKRSSTSMDGSLTVDGPAVGPGSSSYSECVMSPSKRAKLYVHFILSGCTLIVLMLYRLMKGPKEPEVCFFKIKYWISIKIACVFFKYPELGDGDELISDIYSFPRSLCLKASVEFLLKFIENKTCDAFFGYFLHFFNGNCNLKCMSFLKYHDIPWK